MGPRDSARRQPPKHSASVVLKDDTSFWKGRFFGVGVDTTKRKISFLYLSIYIYTYIRICIYVYIHRLVGG